MTMFKDKFDLMDTALIIDPAAVLVNLIIVGYLIKLKCPQHFPESFIKLGLKVVA